MEEKEKFKNALIELRELMTLYGRNTMKNQLSIISSILEDIETVPLDKLKIVARGLFIPKVGISEFNVWKDDFQERNEINLQIDSARSLLWEMVKDSI